MPDVILYACYLLKVPSFILKSVSVKKIKVLHFLLIVQNQLFKLQLKIALI